MPPIKPIKKFACTITELYAICRFGWNKCMENLAAFALLKAFYDAAYVGTALAEIDAAEDMPDEAMRNEQHTTLRIELEQAAEAALQAWRFLRTYIHSAFAPEFQEGKINAAGGTYYYEAIRENWEDMQAMLNAGQNFITNNLAVLTAAGMPAGFQATYDAGFLAFGNKYGAFKDAQADAEAGTVARMIANNDLYDRVQEMNFDGQALFENDPERYDLFVFSRVKEWITPPSGVPPTSLILYGVVKNGGTQQPMIHVPILLTLPGAQPITVETVEFGRYVFEQTGMSPGTIYPHMKIEVAGFEVFEKDLELTIGNKYEENVVLVPIV